MQVTKWCAELERLLGRIPFLKTKILRTNKKLISLCPQNKLCHSDLRIEVSRCVKVAVAMIGARLKVTQEFDPSAGSFFGKIVLEGKKLKSNPFFCCWSFLSTSLYFCTIYYLGIGIFWNLDFNTKIQSISKKWTQCAGRFSVGECPVNSKSVGGISFIDARKRKLIWPQHQEKTIR